MLQKSYLCAPRGPFQRVFKIFCYKKCFDKSCQNLDVALSGRRIGLKIRFMKSMEIAVGKTLFDEIAAGTISTLEVGINPTNEAKYVEYFDEEREVSHSNIADVTESRSAIVLRPVWYDAIKISCAKGSNGPILKRVKSIEILFHTDSSGNFVECSLYGKEYLKATVQYVLQ